MSKFVIQVNHSRYFKADGSLTTDIVKAKQFEQGFDATEFLIDNEVEGWVKWNIVEYDEATYGKTIEITSSIHDCLAPSKYTVYRAHVFKDGKTYTSSIPNIPGIVSQGDSSEEALENLKEAFIGCVECYLEAQGAIPWDVVPYFITKPEETEVHYLWVPLEFFHDCS